MFLIFFFFLLMENLGAMAYSRYTGFCGITDRDVLELYVYLKRHVFVMFFMFSPVHCLTVVFDG